MMSPRPAGGPGGNTPFDVGNWTIVVSFCHRQKVCPKALADARRPALIWPLTSKIANLLVAQMPGNSLM